MEWSPAIGNRGVGRTGRGRWRNWLAILGIGMVFGLGGVKAEEHSKIPLPSYHYGAKIPVECLNRSM
jgi:hypothetical protein